jgi:hypothetical protein
MPSSRLVDEQLAQMGEEKAQIWHLNGRNANGGNLQFQADNVEGTKGVEQFGGGQGTEWID